MYRILVLFFIIFSSSLIYCDLRFEPCAINDDNSFIFNSIEKIGESKLKQTLFYGEYKSDLINFKALSYYPDVVKYNNISKNIYIQNRMGLYFYNTLTGVISQPADLPSFSRGDEYSVTPLSQISVSPDSLYLLIKDPVSPTRTNIILYNCVSGKSQIVVKDADRAPGEECALWSNDSQYFIYQKNNNIYYFGIKDYFEKKILSEELRYIGNIRLKNCSWSDTNMLYWIEKKLIYKTDPNEFYYRSIYKSYLRQGRVIGKIYFDFDPAFDTFIINENSAKVMIVKDGISILYYSLTDDITKNPYLQLNDNMRFDKAVLKNNGEGALSIRYLDNGIVKTDIILIKKNGNDFDFVKLDKTLVDNDLINDFVFDKKMTGILVTCVNGAYFIDIASDKKVWDFKGENIRYGVNTGENLWYLFGDNFMYKHLENENLPVLLSSSGEAGFWNGEIYVTKQGINYRVSKNNGSISKTEVLPSNINKSTKSNYYRILSREIKKGFYKDALYLKELYSGKQIEITGEPKLKYTLFQPELKESIDFYNNPRPQRYETALVFDCIKSAEGVFPILTALQKYGIKANFFINGQFIDVNPKITREISLTGYEIGNMFEFYVNLTDNKFVIDKNFIRQGLSSNEEKYFNLTKDNFSPYWHAPMYAYSESIIRYGLESGYKFVSYNIDSLDWIDKKDKQLYSRYYMNNKDLIDRVLSKLTPGTVIVFNAGKNDTERDEWLFNDIETLICEIIRSGYQFADMSDILSKYRDVK